MKRTILLAILFLILGGGAWYATQGNKSRSVGMEAPEMQFAVDNPDDIYKIFIADRKGTTATIERKSGYWLYNGKWKARPTAIENLLKTVSKVKVSYLAVKAAEKTMIESLASEGIKVEIYNKNDEKIKCYYVGGVTNDERGTYMMMEGAEIPYITHIPNFVGQLRVRYLLGDDNWRDRSIFDAKAADIQSISVDYTKEKTESFVVEKSGSDNYTVKPLNSITPVNRSPQRKGIPEAYLAQFEQKIAESFETANPQRDSILQLPPFATITLTKTDGKKQKVRFWPVEIQIDPNLGTTYIERYFTDIDDETFMLTQQHVMGVLFRGYNFFFESESTKLKN